MAKSIRIALCQRQMAGDAMSHVKDQHIHFHLQPLTLGSGKGGGRADQRCLRRETGNGSFEESAQRVDHGILVLSLPPYYSSHPAEADHAPMNRSGLRGKQLS